VLLAAHVCNWLDVGVTLVACLLNGVELLLLLVLLWGQRSLQTLPRVSFLAFVHIGLDNYRKSFLPLHFQ
jgi:hypothetical protein